MSGECSSASAWRPVPGAVPLCAWRTGALHRMAQALAEVLGAWAADWDLPAPGRPCCTPSASVALDDSSSWVRIGTASTPGAWLQWDPMHGRRLAECWFDGDAAGSAVVTSVLQACHADAVQRVAAALRIDGDVVECMPANLPTGPWSGGVVAHLDGHGVLVMEAALAKALAGCEVPASANRPDKPLVRVQEALRHTPIDVQVQLDGCALDVGELQSLQLGDVLTLRHRVDAPVAVSHRDGCVLLSGWLARVRGRRAVELGPSSPRP